MLESLLAPVVAAPEPSIKTNNPPAAPKKRKRVLSGITVTIMTVIIISIITYMLVATDSTSKAIVQGPLTLSGTGTVLTTPPSAPIRTLTPDPDALAIDAQATPTRTSTATTTATPQSATTATPVTVKSTQPAQATATPTPVPPLFTGQLSTQVNQLGASATTFIPSLTVSDVRIEADVTVKGDSGGIIFRTGYHFLIDTNGSYNFGTSTSTLANNYSSAIKTGNNVSNHVTIVAKGHTITISVNAQSLINLNDSSYSSGKVGVMATEFLSSTTTVCNFNIYSD
jgi:hypothetical protein